MPYVYQNYTQDALDRECSPSAMVRNHERYFEQYAALSRDARATHPDFFSVFYGEEPLRTLDIFPARAANAPVLVFFHGGGWRSLSKDDSSFVALGFVPHGITVAVANYRLLPKVRIADIVGDACAAVGWIHENAAAIGVDRDRIFLSGHSAGAHLVGMILGKLGQDISQQCVGGALLLSGNYFLEPLRLSSRNRILQLDAEEAYRLSPLEHLPRCGPPILVAWGEQESAQYKTQGRDYARAWRSHGMTCTELEIPGDHFSVPLDLAQPGGALTQSVLQHPIFLGT